MSGSDLCNGIKGVGQTDVGLRKSELNITGLRNKAKSIPRLMDILLFLLWLGVGVGVRFWGLTSKPLWTDEFSTIVFSLGNSFTQVPVDQAIALETLLQPLQVNPQATVADVVSHLLQESNHPPLYFILTHLWLALFPAVQGYVSLWGARSLAALFGVFSIPAMYGLGLLTFRSRGVAHFAAAMMAVSPYAVFLAQEARHYTLSILWVITSLVSFGLAVGHFKRRKPLKLGLILLWIAVNGLGIATHYLFVLTVAAEAIAVLVLIWTQPNLPRSLRFGLIAVAQGSLISGLVWLPLWHNGLGSELTAWISTGSQKGWQSLEPVFQAIAAWLTMICLLPVESPNLVVVIVSGCLMLSFFLWLLPILCASGCRLRQLPERSMMTLGFKGFVGGAIALIFIITYGLGMDLTRGARYHFLYFPAVILLVGACLATCWQTRTVKSQWFQFPAVYTRGKIAVISILAIGFLSSLTVISNLGYQKYYRPDLLLPIIAQHTSPQTALLFATSHHTHVETGEMMSIAWELLHHPLAVSPQFLLAEDVPDPKRVLSTLQKTLNQRSRPVDLWLFNFHVPVNLEAQNCGVEPQPISPVNGYAIQLYHCR